MKKPAGNRGLRLLLLSLLGLIGVFVWLIVFAYRGVSGATVSLGTAYAYADRGQIDSATLHDEDAQVVGRVSAAPCTVAAPPGVGSSGATSPSPPPSRVPCAGPFSDFVTTYPRSDAATQQLISKIATSGADLSVDKQTDKAIAKLLLTFVLPLIILANLFGIIFLSRGGDSSLAEVIGFATLGRKKQRRPSTGLTFGDVAGVEEAVAELREVTDYLRDPGRFQAYGANAPKGVLLAGPPGCGKTLIARAVAGESGVPFFSISGAEFVESLVGVGAARARSLFREVRESAPAILFIDEIDAVGRRRGGEGTTGGEREQTVNQLLVEMDGFEVSSGIVVIGATNRPDILDPALLRPGRFDRHVTVEAPNVHGREAILRLYGRGKPIAADVDVADLARRTPGFTGADLANLVNEAALLAIREGQGRQTEITAAHLSEAILRVLHGPRRRGRLMTAEETRRIAYHEAGHALVAAALGRVAINRVSIVARGGELGQSTVGEGERVLLTRSELEAQLCAAMGGMTAEQLCFGEPSTAAEDDIGRATELAREMAGRYGMDDELGAVRMLAKHNGHLGGDVELEELSGETMRRFDDVVRRLIGGARERAWTTLSVHRPQLDAFAQRLEVEETLEGAVLESLLAPVRPAAR